MSQREIAQGAAWSRVVFTTYALSLSFFETVAADSLTRGGARDVLILADLAGVRESLSEKGVRGIGRDYRVEPVAVRNGVFHPKIGAFVTRNEAVLTVGSGNLTFGGWANNLEMVETLHPGFAGAAFTDAADFFARLADHPRLRHAVADDCGALAEDLRRHGATGGGDDIRLLHSLDRSIAGQLADWAAELGGAESLTVASPYWDDSRLAGLLEALGLESVQAHSHPLTAPGSALNWPVSTAGVVQAVRLSHIADDSRALHAKAIEVQCRNGRLLACGSANATAAALGAERNVEAMVLRVQRQRRGGWSFTPASPPPPVFNAQAEGEATRSRQGVLRAELDEARLSGWVLSPHPRGHARLEQVTARGLTPLGDIEIDQAGRFRLEAPDLENQAWSAGRLVVRATAQDGAAEGYVASGLAGPVARRAGVMAPRLFAFLNGVDAPEDAVALMDWLMADETRLPRPETRAGGGPASPPPPDDAPLTAAEIAWTEAPAVEGTQIETEADRRIYDRLWRQLGLVFSTPKPAYEAPDEGDDAGEGERSAARGDPIEARRRRHEAVQEQARALVGRFLDWALAPERTARRGMLAFAWVNHMADRLETDPAMLSVWLQRLAGGLSAAAVPEDQRAAVAVALLGLAASPGAPARARAVFLRLGLPIDGAVPDCPAQALSPRLRPADPEALWAAIGATTTPMEDALALAAALRTPGSAPLETPLRQSCPDMWPRIERALSDERARARVIFAGRGVQACPQHHVKLPTQEIDRYRTRLMAVAGNCCDRLILFGGDPS